MKLAKKPKSLAKAASPQIALSTVPKVTPKKAKKNGSAKSAVNTPRTPSTPNVLKVGAAKNEGLEAKQVKKIFPLTLTSFKTLVLQVRVAIEALHKVLKASKAKKEKAEAGDDALDKAQDLFEDSGQRITLMVTGIKLPKESRQQLLHM